MMSDGSGHSRLNDVGATMPSFFGSDVDDLADIAFGGPMDMTAAGGRFLDGFGCACVL